MIYESRFRVESVRFRLHDLGMGIGCMAFRFRIRGVTFFRNAMRSAAAACRGPSSLMAKSSSCQVCWSLGFRVQGLGFWS
jgi:hypothetical protein